MRRLALLLLCWTLAAGLTVPAPAAADSVIGNIVVIEADPTILQPGEPFDLNGKTLTFTPKAGGGYTVTVGALSFDDRLGNQLPMGDDDYFPLVLRAFKFRFFGEDRDNVFIGSNGFVTFDAPSILFHFNADSGGTVSTLGDASTVLDTIAEGLERVAVLWQDWNPAAGGGVFANLLSDRLIITWKDVPLFGTSTTATFQVVLFSSGVIQMNYQSVTTTPGGGYLVGISPGSSVPVFVTTVDFSQGTASSFSDMRDLEPLVQVFGSSSSPLVHVPAVARKLYQSQSDRYDQIVMFANFPEAMGGAFAFNQPVQNTVLGTGRPLFDISSFFGGAQLQSFVNGNQLAFFPNDPNTVFFGTNSTLALLGQEVGHQWLAFPFYEIEGTAACSDQLLGRQLAHWSFFHNTDASVMEGNRWDQIESNPPVLFVSKEATLRYSELDQYMMGLRAPVEVHDFFFISNPSPTGCHVLDPDTGERSCPPQLKVTAAGGRQDVSLSDIVGCEGSRVPSGGFSGINPTTTWRQAFVLLIQGTTPPAADVAKIDTIRGAWVPFFNTATAGRGSIDTSVDIPASITAFVTGLYQNVLGRAADPVGLAAWTAFLAANCTQTGLTAIADAFFDSQEFRTRPLTLADLATIPFRALLGRDPTSQELASVVDQLRQDRLALATDDFIPSAEFQQILPDRTNRAAVTAVVTRFYTEILGRPPDTPGLNAWVDFIVATGDLDSVAEAFLTFPSFEALPLTFRGYVTILYRAFLARSPDPGGLDAWEGVLRADLLEVINADFISSGEFQNRILLICGS